MNKIILTASLIALAAKALVQGTVMWGNTSTTAISTHTPDQPSYKVSPGSAYVVGFCLGPANATSPSAVQLAFTRTFATQAISAIHSLAGVLPKQVFITGIAPVTEVTCMIKSWPVGCPSYEALLNSPQPFPRPNLPAGVSGIGHGTFGGGASPDMAASLSLIGLPDGQVGDGPVAPFTMMIIPDPPTAATLGLGLACLLLGRRARRATLLAAALLGCAATAHAQGTITWGNWPSTAIYIWDFESGSHYKVYPGSSFVVGLYLGSADAQYPSALRLVTTRTFATQATAATHVFAGVFAPQNFITSFPAETTVAYMIKAWPAGYPSFEAYLATIQLGPGPYLPAGASGIGRGVLGGGAVPSFNALLSLTGVPVGQVGDGPVAPFTMMIIPEPTAATTLGLGLALIMLGRRSRGTGGSALALFAAAWFVLPGNARAQASFILANDTARTCLGSLDGQLAGPGYWAQALVRLTPDMLLPIGAPVEHLGNGLIPTRAMTVPGPLPGSTVYVQLAAWDVARWGTSFAAVPAELLGHTDVVSVHLWPLPQPPEKTYFSQPAIVPIPEPGTMALATAGLALLALGRRMFAAPGSVR